jgi:hypothetical protein
MKEKEVYQIIPSERRNLCSLLNSKNGRVSLSRPLDLVSLLLFRTEFHECDCSSVKESLFAERIELSLIDRNNIVDLGASGRKRDTLGNKTYMPCHIHSWEKSFIFREKTPSFLF